MTVGFAAPAAAGVASRPGSRRPAARCRPRSRSARHGAFSLADLSIRPAILADEALGDAFAERHLTPIAGLGMELEDTLRTYLDLGMKIDDTARDAARARQHAAPPAAPFRGGDGRELARSARRRGTLVGTRAPAPPNLEHLFTRATALVVSETVVLVVAIVVAALTSTRRRLGARRPSSRCCSGSRWPPTGSRSATAGSGSPARSWRSCSPPRCSAPRRPPRSASPPCSSTSSAPATRSRS